MEYSTKYWVVVAILALVLLVGTGALSVWICKLYDTQKPPSLPPGVSPFPDVVPIVTPPTTSPTVGNTCYKWCGNQLCPEASQFVATQMINATVPAHPPTLSQKMQCVLKTTR